MEKNKRELFSKLNNIEELEDWADAREVLDRMNPNQNINYHTVLEKLIKKWDLEHKNKKPKILLHSCCAPCSTYTLEFMTQYAEVTILFANNNIHPESEYRLRSQVQQDFINDFNNKTGNNVGYIEDEYKPLEFFKLMRGMEKEPEGGDRCTACFNMRLDIVASRAKELGYDYFGSALTLSPKKNSSLINRLGLEIQKIYETKYLPSDFKKNKGYQRSIELCKEYDVYRQCYCGCIFAANREIYMQKQEENKAYRKSGEYIRELINKYKKNKE